MINTSILFFSQGEFVITNFYIFVFTLNGNDIFLYLNLQSTKVYSKVKDKCDLNVTPLSFIVKCNYASKIKSTLRMQPSDWLKQVMLDEN